MPEVLRIVYARGVTPGRWQRVWSERFPRVRLEAQMVDAVTDAAAQLAAVRAGTADAVFLRLGAETEVPEGLHLIPLYEERPFVVAAKDSAIEAADEVTLAELEGELRHPFDDGLATTIEVVAAGVGVVVVPQSLARLYARRDVIARPVTDAPAWRVGLAWLRDAPPERVPLIDDFIGVVRGRTANSSRSMRGQDAAKDEKPQRPGRSAKAQDGAGFSARGRERRPPRGGRSRRRPTR